MAEARTYGLALPQLVGWGSLYYSFAILVGPMEQTLGLTRFETSGAFSLALIVEGLAAYPVGRWIDQGHGRVVMTCGSTFASLGLAFWSQVSSLVSLYLVWAWLGMSMAMVLYTPAFSHVNRCYGHRARPEITVLTLIGGLASTVFVPVSAILLSCAGWRGAALGLSLINALVCIPIHGFLLRSPDDREPTKIAITSADVEPTDTSNRLRSLGWVALSLVLLTGVTATIPVHLVSLLRELRVEPFWVVAIPASIGLVQVAGRLVLWGLGQRFNNRTVDQVSTALIPVAIGALFFAALWQPVAIWALLLFVPLFGVGNGLMTIVKGTAVARYVGYQKVATWNGWLGLPLSLAKAGSPLLVGWLWTPQVGYRNGLWFLLVAGVVGSLAMVVVVREKR